MFDCSLTLFGMTDLAGAQRLVDVLGAAKFGLAWKPFERMLIGTNIIWSTQATPNIPGAVADCIQELQLSAQWRARPGDQAPYRMCGKAPDLLVLFDGVTGSAVLCRMAGDDIHDAEITLADPGDARNPVALEVLSRWPRQIDILDRANGVQLTVAKSAHEALAQSGNPDLLPGAFEAYCRSRALSAGASRNSDQPRRTP